MRYREDVLAVDHPRNYENFRHSYTKSYAKELCQAAVSLPKGQDIHHQMEYMLGSVRLGYRTCTETAHFIIEPFILYVSIVFLVFGQANCHFKVPIQRNSKNRHNSIKLKLDTITFGPENFRSIS